MRSPELIDKDGKPTGRSIIQDVDTDLDREWYEMMKGVLAPEIFRETETTKGGPGSGNFGHSGRPGKVGGSGPSKGTKFRASAETSTRAVWLGDFDSFEAAQEGGKREFEKRGLGPSLKIKVRSVKPPREKRPRKLSPEEQQALDERTAWAAVMNGTSPRNSLRSSTLAEAEKELQKERWTDFFGMKINQENSPGRTFLLETTGAEKVWFGETLGGSGHNNGLRLLDKEGHELAVAMFKYGNGFQLNGIFKNTKGGMIGVKFMRAMKRYCDITGNQLEVGIVANPKYFRGFPWLKEDNNLNFLYKPNKIIDVGGLSDDS